MRAVDLACAEPAFLDLTMVGLDAIPAPGRGAAGDGLPALARRRRDHRGRRGAARAVQRARLAARRRRASASCCARCSPTTACAGTAGLVARTPVTVIMPTDGDRAMATFDPGEGVTAAELAAVEPRAVVLSIPRLPLAPAGARVYVSVGDIDARALAGGELPAELGRRAGAAGQRARGAPADRAADAETAAAQLARACAARDRDAGPGRRARRRGGRARCASRRARRGSGHDRRRRSVRRRLRLGRPLGCAARGASALGGPVCIPLREGRHRGCGCGDIEGALGGGR